MDPLSRVYGLDAKPWRPSPTDIYGDHLVKLLAELAEAWPSRFFEFDFVIYFHPVYAAIPEFSKRGNGVILIFLSDEEGLIPQELSDQFFAILKTYWPKEDPLGNIISFPIGYSNSAKYSRLVPFQERGISASYAGNFFPNRWDFYRQFTALRFLPPWPVKRILARKIFWHLYKRSGLFHPGEMKGWIPQSRIYFSGGFAQGLTREEYGEVIGQTKIALCPKGFISTECFRLFETMRLGCVIVADELPPTRWYKDSPIIVERNWLGIRRAVEDLLSDPARLIEIHQRTLVWWENVCSEEASAKYLAVELDRLALSQSASHAR